MSTAKGVTPKTKVGRSGAKPAAAKATTPKPAAKKPARKSTKSKKARFAGLGRRAAPDLPLWTHTRDAHHLLHVAEREFGPGTDVNALDDGTRFRLLLCVRGASETLDRLWEIGALATIEGHLPPALAAPPPAAVLGELPAIVLTAHRQLHAGMALLDLEFRSLADVNAPDLLTAFLCARVAREELHRLMALPEMADLLATLQPAFDAARALKDAKAARTGAGGAARPR